jgi:putative OPT family oligopeptide transporter
MSEPAKHSSSKIHGEPAPHEPFVPASQNIKELTPVAVIMGAVLGLVFAASSTYLGLKVGLTVSASIPVAVLSITLFRWFKLRGTILENNIAQTTGSAGESLAAGVAFTLPSLLIMGFDIEFMRVLLVALLGGLIGVLMMIPLRHGLIVKEHGKLAYPEGTACADVLIVGEKGGTEAKTVFLGFFVGLIYTFLNVVTQLWSDTAKHLIEFKTFLANKAVSFKGELQVDVSPPMLGVGYVIGPKVAANMFAGGVMGYMVMIPLVSMFGGAKVAALDTKHIREAYVLYIGAGAVAAGGFISLGRALPTIFSAFRSGIKSFGANNAAALAIPRTEQDLSMKVVLGGSAAIVVAIIAAPILNIDFFTALLVVAFGFFFVTVSSRITGEIGSSSNPISGMTIATLLLTCLLFVLLGRTGVSYKAMALTTAALVCVAASNGGTISQDLKTGYLVGATPRKQQIAIIFGVVTSAVVIGLTMHLLLGSRETLPAVSFSGVTLPVTSNHTTGPDGKTYSVAFVSEDIPIEKVDMLAEGPYLVDADGLVKFAIKGSTLTAITGSDVQLKDPTSVTMNGPDNMEYRIAIIHKSLPTRAPALLTRGRYLVDNKGQPAFFVSTSVDSVYEYRLEKSTAAIIKGVPADAKTELGIDRLPYRVVETDGEKITGAPIGRYLVDDKDTVVYYAKKVEKFDAPKAKLFALIIDGTLGGKLPWGLVIIGVLISIILELVGVSALSFAVGLYLPIATSGGIFIGGIVRYLVDRKRRGESNTEAEFSPGMLMASGLIAGGSIAAVAQAGLMTAEVDGKFDLHSYLPNWLAGNQTWWPMLFLSLMAASLYYVGVFSKKPPAIPTAKVKPAD